MVSDAQIKRVWVEMPASGPISRTGIGVIISLCMAVSMLLFEVPKCGLLSWIHGTTAGLVTKVDATNHAVITVQFTISGTTYSQDFHPENLRIGSPVSVFYYPHSPTVAILEEPRRALLEGVAYSVFGTILIATFTILALRFKVLQKRGF